MNDRKINITEWSELSDCTIAQDDDCDYSESGWICVNQGETYGLARYSHCSCFGTGTAIGIENGKSARFDWEGTLEELKSLVARSADPSMPDRIADTEDYDYDHLMAVYTQLKEYFKKGNQ